MKIVYKRMSIKAKLGKERSEVSSFHYPMKKVWDQKNFKAGRLREIRVKVTGI